MIDSGAFSVWNKGATIDLDAYIKFCKERPNLSVIVGLDVIPPKGARLTDELKDKVAAQGWANYLKMIRVLPMEKVVPVFHRGDSIKWLETMLDFGCPYIGLSPRFDGTAGDRRMQFLSEAKKFIYDSSGNPITKVHGFAVTNHKMMLDFKWYSVDSASWTQVAAFGAILVPRMIEGVWDFTKPPFKIFCSVTAQKRQEAEHHLLAMQEQAPTLYQNTMDWILSNGVSLGKHSVRKAQSGEKPKIVVDRWFDRNKTKILHIEERGVTNCDTVRRWLNMVFFHRCLESIPHLQNLYLAGGGSLPTENQIKYRLKSFVDSHTEVDWIYERIGEIKQERYPHEIYAAHQKGKPFKQIMKEMNA